MAESTVSRSVSASCCSASQRRPLTPNRSDAGGRSFKQRINTAWISFFARERARTNCARRASRRRIARMRSSGVHTPSSWPAHSSLASARASRRSVFARAWRIPVSLGETTITRATCGSRIPAIAHALPVTSNATRSRASRLCANSSSASGLVAIRPAERSRPSATIATSQKSRCTSSATALTCPSSPSLSKQENRWANDIDGSALAAQPGKSQGRPLKSPGSNRPSSKTACPTCVLPEGPSSQSAEPKSAAGHTSLQRAVSCPESEQRPTRGAANLPAAPFDDAGVSAGAQLTPARDDSEAHALRWARTPA